MDKLADGHSLRHEGHDDEETTSGDDIDPRNCPRHVCECDKHFVHTLLKHHKKCLAGEARFCLNDKYRYGILYYLNSYPLIVICYQISAQTIQMFSTSLDMGDKRSPLIFKIALKIISHRFRVIKV